MYTRAHSHAQAHTITYIYTQACKHIHAHTYTHMQTHAYIHPYIHKCVHIRTYPQWEREEEKYQIQKKERTISIDF